MLQSFFYCVINGGSTISDAFEAINSNYLEDINKTCDEKVFTL